MAPPNAQYNRKSSRHDPATKSAKNTPELIGKEPQSKPSSDLALNTDQNQRPSLRALPPRPAPRPRLHAWRPPLPPWLHSPRETRPRPLPARSPSAPSFHARRPPLPLRLRRRRRRRRRRRLDIAPASPSGEPIPSTWRPPSECFSFHYRFAGLQGFPRLPRRPVFCSPMRLLIN